MICLPPEQHQFQAERRFRLPFRTFVAAYMHLNERTSNSYQRLFSVQD